jgi:DNA polymerase III subunit epsilon
MDGHPMMWLASLFGVRRGAPVALGDTTSARLDHWRRLAPAELGLGHFQSRYVVVDLEASGLDPGKDRLISIGAVAVENGVIDPQGAFEVVLRQSKVSDTSNILLHGIGASAQREGAEPQEALLGFLEYLGKSPLVAYHTIFDQVLIERAMREFLGFAFRHPWLDLAWILPALFREHIDGNARLDDWLAVFGVENILRHNAVADSLATAQLLQIAFERAKNVGMDTPAELMAAEKSRRWLRRAQ